MSSITVFCPNARRQQVKVDANMKILQIIDEVCKKQGLNSDEYDLIFQKRKLDVTLAFRLCGVPLNAQLELKKLDVPRKVSDVVIALQLEDGSRLPQQSFKPDACLFDLLNVFRNVPDSLLLALDASIQDMHKLQPICSYLNEEVIGEYQLKNTQLKDLGLTGGRAIVRFNYRVVDEEKFERSNADFTEKLERKIQLEQTFKRAQSQQVVEPPSRVHAEVPKSVVPQPIPQSVPKAQPKPSVNTAALNTMMDVDESHNAAFSDRPVYNNEFANFKFPESTKGMVMNDINELAEIEALSKKACERLELIYNIEEKHKANQEAADTAQEDIPDDFYDLTVNDLRLMLDDLERKKNSEQPLMTKQMRELENDKKAMKYEKVVIRIKFQNRVILQGLFRPKEPVQALYSFVESAIEPTNETKDFYLYTTPPKLVLSDRKKNLFDANLCPASIVHFGTTSGAAPNFNATLLSNMKTSEEADEIAKTNVHQRMRNIKHEGIEWLEKENAQARNLLKSSGLLNNNRPSTSSSSITSSATTTTSRTPAEDAKREKLERFFKGTKK